MIGIYLSYFFAVAIAICAIIIGVTFFKKRLQSKLHWGGFAIGVVASVFYVLLIMLLYRVTFSKEAYFNTVGFKTIVGFVYIALLAAIRMIILRMAAFNRYKEEQGLSFCFGLGAAPLGFLAIYSIFMFCCIAWNSIVHPPCVIEAEGFLSFADNTIISIFQPIIGHISYAILFVALAAIVVAFGYLLNIIATRRIKPLISVIWFIAVALLEAGALLPVFLGAMYRLNHWQPALIAVINAVIAVLMVRFIPLQKEEQEEYIKQFE